MDGGHVRNMKSTLSNKYEKFCISLAFIIRIYHSPAYEDGTDSEFRNVGN